MALIHLNQGGFDKLMEDGTLTLVDFWAEWCGPCKMLTPVMEELATTFDGRAVIGKVDVDEESGLAQQFGVMSIPTVILFKDGKEVERKVGFQPADGYVALLEEHLNNTIV